MTERDDQPGGPSSAPALQPGSHPLIDAGDPCQDLRCSGKWSTPTQGDIGLLDLILARDGEVLLRELKSEKGKPTPDQTLWLEALGDHGRIWRPSDWVSGTIQNELRRHR